MFFRTEIDFVVNCVVLFGMKNIIVISFIHLYFGSICVKNTELQLVSYKCVGMKRNVVIHYTKHSFCQDFKSAGGKYSFTLNVAILIEGSKQPTTKDTNC